MKHERPGDELPGDALRELSDRVAVVTGGAGGIGRALGERCAAEGMKVVLADLDEPALDRTVKELSGRSLPVIGVATDVTSLESVERLRDVTLERFGGVHLLCNNAGIPSGSDGQLWEHHMNDWRWAMDVNVYGVVHGINAFVPVMLDQGVPGHIVNTSSSNGGFYPLYNSAIYATTKAAIVTVTECLWGQLRALGAPLAVSVLLPSTRTPGILGTGIWRPGRNRPDRYGREGAPGPEGRDALAPFREQLAKAGQEVTFAPLDEVAELALEGIRDDRFWIHVPSQRNADLVEARARSIIDRQPPDYLLEPTPLNVPKTSPGPTRGA